MSIQRAPGRCVHVHTLTHAHTHTHTHTRIQRHWDMNNQWKTKPCSNTPTRTRYARPIYISTIYTINAKWRDLTRWIFAPNRFRWKFRWTKSTRRTTESDLVFFWHVEIEISVCVCVSWLAGRWSWFDNTDNDERHFGIINYNSTKLCHTPRLAHSHTLFPLTLTLSSDGYEQR